MGSWISGIIYAVGGFLLVWFGIANTCQNWSGKKCVIVALCVMLSPLLYLVVYAVLGLH